MRAIKALSVLATLLATTISFAGTGSPSADNHASIMIVFQDGHRQSIDMSDIVRIEFKTPVTIVFKNGRQQNVSATDIARIEFEPATSTAGRNRFVGKWQVGEGNGSNFYITLEADGQARKSIGESHGTWTVVAGEARISWDDGCMTRYARLAPATKNAPMNPASRSAILPPMSLLPEIPNPNPFSHFSPPVAAHNMPLEISLA